MDEASERTKRFPLDTERIWDLVGRKLDQLASDWESATEPPDLAGYIRDLPAIIQRTTLIELIKLDMEQRWTRRMNPWQVEQYVAEFPELVSSELAPVDLIYEEYHVRRQNESDVRASEYARRFPRQADELCRLLDTSNPLLTTSIRPSKAIETIRVGDKIDDFDLLHRLGQGAFAIVFLAHQRSMQRLVAVKITADSSHEPQTLARLDHPHIVRVYDQRVVAERKLRLLYMQYVSGGTLQDALRMMQCHLPAKWSGQLLLDCIDKSLTERGVELPLGVEQRQRLTQLNWPATISLLGSQIASALDYAHAQGVLHRDLKPANILLNEFIHPLLVDFNVSSCSKLDGATPAAYFGGSLAYMSPEQLEACNPRHERKPDSLDGRSDIYALGIVLWELLTGVRPFVDHQLSDGWPATVEAMAERRKKGLTVSQHAQLPPNCPTGLRAVLERCLAPTPDNRYATAAEVAAQLRRQLHPEAERIFAPLRGWRAMVAQWPTLSIVLTLLIPNALAGIFNYYYNYVAIIDRRQGAEPIFQNVQRIINSTAFPLGVAIGLFLIWRVVGEVAMRSKKHVASQSALRLRQQCLQLGHQLALLSLSLWVVAGFAYPAAMYMSNSPLQLVDYVHFFGSLTLCGLIVAAYPFFGAASIIVEAWYPLMCGTHRVKRDDLPRIQWLQRIMWRYLVTAVLVPMLATTILIVMDDHGTRFLLILLAVGGLICFAVVFQLAQRLQADLDVLREDVQQ